MKKTIKGIYYFSFVIYMITLFLVLFFKSRGYLSGLPMIEYIKYNSNIVPFKTIYTYIKALFDGTMNVDIPVKNLLGNLLLFAPMGLYLTCSFKKLYIFKNYILCIVIILVSVEIGQLLLRRGSFDIDDFILNIVGAIIGFAIVKVKGIQCLLKKASMISENKNERL